MSKIEEAKQNVGELLMIGFEGKTLSPDTEAFLSQARIGGVIYFAHNYESPEQIANLSSEIQACKTSLPLWISVDHEGGRVQRFKEPFSIIPKAREIANLSAAQAFEISEIAAIELAAVGVNLNYTPVADINTNPKNPVIGDRAFGEDEETVTKFVSAMVRGHLVHGVQPCVKHFPGHGDTELDSHFALPKVSTDLETLRARELKPFMKAFKSRCAFVMTAHILNEKMNHDLPATFSKDILIKLLREELRYQKIIMSDDLEMQAVTDHFGEKEAPIKAIDAGCDMLIYRSEKAARIGYLALQEAIDDEILSPDRVLESVRRCREVKKEVLSDLKTPSPKDVMKVVGCKEHQEKLKSFGF